MRVTLDQGLDGEAVMWRACYPLYDFFNNQFNTKSYALLGKNMGTFSSFYFL